MKAMGRRIWDILPLMAWVGLVAVCLYALTPTQWRMLGDGAATLAVRLQAPRESIEYWQHAKQYAASPSDGSPAFPTVYTGELYDASASVIPPKGDGGGAVSEEQLGGEAVVGAVAIKNSSGVSFDFEALLKAGVSLGEATDGPQVLIVHTHATERYMSYYAGYYNDDDPVRSTDNAENVTAVGEAIAQELRAAGIGVIHDTTHHDHPAYTGAYDRSAQTVSAYLREYPSIRVVLDIHRDAIMRDDLTKVKPTTTVAGQKASQMMIIVGATSTEERPNAYCEDNLRFGLGLHQALEEAHSGLMRPLYLVDARYNQGLKAGSLLVEIGTDANTLSESLVSGRLLGKQLAAMLAR
ncbi:MAG: stage II sporulation protein P [Clostridia bacterium]|nr:stage II sporulation protein P [Clostridia bacterium]